MADTLLYALVIYGVGCIIPTPLDPAPPQANFAPVILTNRASPPFGPISHAQGDDIPFDIFIDDPDDDLPTTQDNLHARLFFYNAATTSLNRANGDEYVFGSVVDANDPTLREASFTATGLCAARTGTSLLYLVVADRPFSPTQPSQVVNGGGSDSNYWVLTCN